MTNAKPELDIVYLDFETTGLGPAAQAFEIAWKPARPGYKTRSYFLEHTLVGAEQPGLNKNRYWERNIAGSPTATQRDLNRFREETAGVCVMAANPRFDARFVEEVIGYEPYHHRMMDIETYAVPVLGLRTPPGMETLAQMLQDLAFPVPTPNHTAAGDVETLEACHVALMQISNEQRGGTVAVTR